MKELSLRKYAATIGVSHTAIAKAIKSGYIVKGWDANRKKIIVDLANEEWGNSIKERTLSGGNEQQKQENEPAAAELTFEPLTENLSFNEARRLKEIYNAELARITALKEQGVYVERDKVYSQLFEFGKHLRVAFQSIPNRVVDNMLAARSRNEAFNILLEAINTTLEQLTAPPELSQRPAVNEEGS